ncbi:hypothetical protein ICJ85_15350 [Aestuariibaculum marinum]|uniref:Uncharacterized protein n=1 Tax=Aestuariibaculum marinum TaxID=2683592 RepID=A0A8J6Q8M0_9FLAO|nr:hypothetical protein [Aestuariibaculum marinum]
MNKADIITSITKSVAGAVPFAGSLLSEIIENTIPNQRFDRLIKYVKELDERISRIPTDKFENLSTNPRSIDLIEESFYQASRALSSDRRSYIINIVINGISDDGLKQENAKVLLKILQELNDIEIIWLRYYLDPTVNGDKEFRKKHENVLKSIYPYIGADKETLNQSAIQKNYRTHLERLGLIVNKLEINRKTGQPEFERTTGLPKVRYTRITTLGEMLLENIGFTKN